MRARPLLTSSTERHRIPLAPALGPDRHDLIWLPEEAFASAFAQHASA
jgi:hypothetical protein